jgi:hypothetical protein
MHLLTTTRIATDSGYSRRPIQTQFRLEPRHNVETGPTALVSIIKEHVHITEVSRSGSTSDLILDEDLERTTSICAAFQSPQLKTSSTSYRRIVFIIAREIIPAMLRCGVLIPNINTLR